MPSTEIKCETCPLNYIKVGTTQVEVDVSDSETARATAYFAGFRDKKLPDSISKSDEACADMCAQKIKNGRCVMWIIATNQNEFALGPLLDPKFNQTSRNS